MHIEREPVQGHPLGDPHPHRTNLGPFWVSVIFNPHPGGLIVPKTFDPKFSQRVDDGLLHACKPRPKRLRSTIGHATSCPGPCQVTSPPRSVRSRSTPMDAKCSGEASRLVSAPARLETVITAGSCSNNSSRWGAGDCSLPATTSAWCFRCRASASRYRTRPKSIVSSVQSSAMALQDTLPGCDHLPYFGQRLFGQREPA